MSRRIMTEIKPTELTMNSTDFSFFCHFKDGKYSLQLLLWFFLKRDERVPGFKDLRVQVS
jgi:hypothetical protein